MPIRLIALDEGPDIHLDRAMLIVGRHPQCDARIDSIRVSRRHCCMMPDKDNGDIVVRDLGSTNGIRINGQRVEAGSLRPGDELSIAHIRYRMESGHSPEDVTMVESLPAIVSPGRNLGPLPSIGIGAENPLAAAVRDLLPGAVADRCRIQVIVQMPPEAPPAEPSDTDRDAEAETPESQEPCPPDSSRSTPA